VIQLNKTLQFTEEHHMLDEMLQSKAMDLEDTRETVRQHVRVL